jgi:hypothetical protein
VEARLAETSCSKDGTELPRSGVNQSQCRAQTIRIMHVRGRGFQCPPVPYALGSGTGGLEGLSRYSRSNDDGQCDLSLGGVPGVGYNLTRCRYGCLVGLVSILDQLAVDHAGHDLVDALDGLGVIGQMPLGQGSHPLVP